MVPASDPNTITPPSAAASDAASDAASAATSAASDATPRPPRAPVIGDIVHVPLDRGVNTGACRAAMVVNVLNDRLINAQLFADNVNDHEEYRDRNPWLTSLPYAPPSATPREARLATWHYIGEDLHATSGVTASLASVVPVTEPASPSAANPASPSAASAVSDGPEVPGAQPAVDEQASGEA